VVAAALGVVLISVLLTMVVTFWVPAWGYDSEVEHSRRMLEAFGDFKNAAESLALSGQTNHTLTTTFPLGVAAVPLFGAETPGQISYRYLDSGVLRFQMTLTDTTGQVNLSAAGSLQYTCPNRYFVRQTISYESGAVILNQSTGSTMRLPPPIQFLNGTGGVSATVTLVSLEGEQKTVTGVEPHTISSRLTVAYTRPYTWASGTVLNLTITTHFPVAWARFFNDSAVQASLPAGNYSITTLGTQAPYTVRLTVNSVTALTASVALLNVRLD
jgi:hypothetical protein